MMNAVVILSLSLSHVVGVAEEATRALIGGPGNAGASAGMQQHRGRKPAKKEERRLPHWPGNPLPPRDLAGDSLAGFSRAVGFWVNPRQPQVYSPTRPFRLPRLVSSGAFVSSFFVYRSIPISSARCNFSSRNYGSLLGLPFPPLSYSVRRA